MIITVVTFNDNEKAAVDSILELLLGKVGSRWNGDTKEITRPNGRQSWTIRHRGLLAQGNVVAAAALADLYRSPDDGPNYVVFFGCAGALDPADAGSVFLVDSVRYVSLGTVDPRSPTSEKVTVKSKWLCQTVQSPPVTPLQPVNFPLLTKQGSVEIRRLTGLPVARVAATDKVVRVPPGTAPPPIVPQPPPAKYEAEGWTYAQALGLVAEAGETTLVEMESYGIGRIAHSLGLIERVIVMRVTTDSLADKADTDRSQGELLMDGRAPLARLLFELFTLGV